MEHVIENSRLIAQGGLYQSRHHKRDVGKKAVKKRAKVVRKGVVLAVVAIFLSLTFVWTRVRVIQLGYEVSKLNRQLGDLIRQKNQLEVEVAKLKSPDRLESMAIQRFNMRLPLGDEIVFVKSSSK